MSGAGARSLGIVGGGRIARRVAAGIRAGAAGDWDIVGVLVRSLEGREGELPWVVGMDAFRGRRPDLILELAGPDALSALGVALIECADVWSIGGSALADPVLEAAIAAAATRTGHRLRLVSAAIAGLDGVGAASIASDARVTVRLAPAGTDPDAEPDFRGTARELARRFHGVNIVAAAAFAGIGLDRTTVEYFRPLPEGGRRHHTIHAQSEDGSFLLRTGPVSTPDTGTKTVSASLLSGLRQLRQPIWAG